MDSIANAIVYAVAYIHCRDEGEDLVEDEDDDSAIAHIMAYLSHATPEEEDALAAAAERALKEEQSLHHPQQDMIEFFESWMEIMFGMDCDGNKRAS
jgi:hypothetical protein